MSKGTKTKGMVTGLEKSSYGLYFLGQNIFYMLIYMYMNTYFTDVGISAVAVAGIALVVKVWDAVNDPIFGGLVDKVKFKKGKFVPWLKISLVGIPLSTVLMFAIPTGVSPVVKIIWASVAYILWDTAYTICDVPIFGLVTTLTSVQQERTVLNAIGRVCGMTAAMLVMVIIPTFRSMLGGWTSTVIMLSVVGAITMLPICFTAKERVAPPVNENEVGLKEMFTYLKSNKFLVIYYAAFMISGTLNVGSSWGLYISRFCLENEAISSVTGLLAIVPSIVLGMIIPSLTRKVDKFKLYYAGVAATLVLTLARFLVGYHNLTTYLIITVVSAIPTGLTATLMYMFTPDCAEYGRYKTGIAAPGITFATQTFFVKLQSALVVAVSSLVLASIGFVEGEGAVQAAGFADKLWNCSIIFPAVGILISLIVLRAYKLNDHDVELMAKANSGEITREEAEAQMINKY